MSFHPNTLLATLSINNLNITFVFLIEWKEDPNIGHEKALTGFLNICNHLLNFFAYVGTERNFGLE